MGNTSQFSYDALNRRTSTTDALGGVSQTTFDAEGNVTAVTNQLGNSSQFSYDNLDRLVSRTDALGNGEVKGAHRKLD